MLTRRKFLAGTAVIPLSSTSNCRSRPRSRPNTYRVEHLTSTANFSPRDGARLEYFNDRLHLIGGWWSPAPSPGPGSWGPSNIDTNQVWGSDDAIVWDLELEHVDTPPVTGPSARFYPIHTMMTWQHQNALWLAGGDDQWSGQEGTTGVLKSGMWKSYDARTWHSVSNSSPWGYGMGVWNPIPAVYDGYMHVLGGRRPSAPGQSLLDWPATPEHWRSLDGLIWERLPDMPFARASVYKALAHRGKLVVIGGTSGPISNGITHDDVWTWDRRRGWSQTSANSSGVWLGREWIATAEFDDRIWALTGFHRESYTNLGGCFCSDDFGRSWSSVDAPWTGSHADGVAETPSGIVLASGRLQDRNVYRVEID